MIIGAGRHCSTLFASIPPNGEHCRDLFISEHKAPLSIGGAQKLVERLGKTAGLAFPAHIHMLAKSTSEMSALASS